MQIFPLIIDTRCLIKTEIKRKIVLAVARSEICCVTALADKNITTEEKIKKQETFYRKSKNIPESPFVANASVLRRRRPRDEVAINKQKFKRPFLNEDGEWIFD